MRSGYRALAPMVLLFACVGADAQDSVVIYRCTAADGTLTLQNDVPCPKGERQERRVIETTAPGPVVPSPAPAPTIAPAPEVAPAPAAAADAVVAEERLPPPALFECRTYDDRRYLSEIGEPPERCAPLQTTGVGGAKGMGAGVACELVTDQCQPIADEALCESWSRNVREAEAALRFGRFESREAAEAEIERTSAIVRESTCGAS